MYEHAEHFVTVKTVLTFSLLRDYCASALQLMCVMCIQQTTRLIIHYQSIL